MLYCLDALRARRDQPVEDVDDSRERERGEKIYYKSR